MKLVSAGPEAGAGLTVVDAGTVSVRKFGFRVIKPGPSLGLIPTVMRGIVVLSCTDELLGLSWLDAVELPAFCGGSFSTLKLMDC